MQAPRRGIIVAAPSSGSGKTTVTLGLIRALRNAGKFVSGAKSGPDYIDPKFHTAAGGGHGYNLDAWAMSPARIRSLTADAEFLIVEGAMGLFDGAPPNGKGSVADLSKILKLPVILVIDASKMAQSVAAIVKGFATHDPDVRVAGIILNKVGSARHERLLRAALAPLAIPVLGALMRDNSMASPSRHLGLVQASERKDLKQFIQTVACQVAKNVDLEQFCALAAPLTEIANTDPGPKAEKILAVPSDSAFSFIYPHWFYDLEMNGWTTRPFSPLRNEPVPKCDAVFLPGGYPELHADTLSKASNFMDSLRKCAQTTDIYGECGGYMVLGETLTDAEGTVHNMAGLLPLKTSFADRKLHLGYRSLSSDQGWVQGHFKAHEFHYATTLSAEGEPLFKATDAEGTALPDMGLRKGKVCGSFAHIIDRACPDDAIPLPLFP